MKPPVTPAQQTGIENLEQGLFEHASSLRPEERHAYLVGACPGDASMIHRLEELLRAHNNTGDFMATPAAGDLRAGVAVGFGITSESAAVGVAVGDRIGRYRIIEPIGEGGFGVVYLAEQEEPVRRPVAVKIIKPGMDTRAIVTRFEAERQALALMEHPNIARVFDGGATDAGRPYFVMELVRGISITRYCDENQLPPEARFQLFITVCHAVQHAHQKGVIHRDLKPSNILVTVHDGAPVPKVIDFGIAKATRAHLTNETQFTQFHAFIGTPAYTSPEQMEMSGRDVDTRSDVYSLGVLLYELLTGRPPFDPKELLEIGIEEMRRTIREKEPLRPSTQVSTLDDAAGAAIARQRGTELAKLRSWLRGDLDWIVMRCLEKDRTRRYQTANDLATDLQRYLRNEPVVARPPSTAYVLRKFVRRHRVGVFAAAATVGVIVIGSIVTTGLTLRALRAERLHAELRVAAHRATENEAAARGAAEQEQRRFAKIRWARETALPEINRLIQIDDIVAAFTLAREAEEFIPDDPALIDVWLKIMSPAAFETSPSGAGIYAKPYSQPSADWEYVGATPIASARLARAPYRYQIRKNGFEMRDETDAGFFYESSPFRRFKYTLVPIGSDEATPSGMVRVPGKALGPALTRLEMVDLEDYWIDMHEVTNREFKAFVDAGGYASAEFWEHRFETTAGGALAWAEATALFRDATGKPGPATWTNGCYAEDKDDHPVTGVSWFEAAAYARFAGKRLPSIYHWRYAAPVKELQHVIHFSNFQGRGPAPVGSHQGMHVHGTFDMAGNAKEWCWNEADNGKRYLLGGGWRDPVYMFGSDHAQSPFDRSDQNGFRCVKLISDRPLDMRADAPRVVKRHDYADDVPVSDAAFQAFKMLYAYDKANLDPALESRDESHRQWRREKATFNAAYNGERMGAIVFLPKRGKSPYQTILFFPGAGAAALRSSDNVAEMAMIAPWLESGRAVVYPILKGTYERAVGVPSSTGQAIAGRDRTVQWHKDVVRTIDYLETRSDIDVGRMAFIGFSWGGGMGPVVSALEPRLKVNVLIAGGLPATRQMPEVDPFNFAPRVTAPTLMVNGRYDFTVPLETLQLPLFNRLGTGPEHKRHVLLDSDHMTPINQTNAEILIWLDRYLGHVQ